jgi:glycine betaine/choline ABC-type transport system substrate-binding protein
MPQRRGVLQAVCLALAVQTMARYGPRLLATLDAVSAGLSTGTLRNLDARVELFGRDPRSVADGWLRARALIPEGRGVR